jgi:hypothetical protein
VATPVVALLGGLGLGLQAVLRVDHGQPASGKALLERIEETVSADPALSAEATAVLVEVVWVVYAAVRRDGRAVKATEAAP